MSEQTEPNHRMALARRIDHVAFEIRTGQGNDHKNAEALRDYADLLERKV